MNKICETGLVGPLRVGFQPSSNAWKLIGRPYGIKFEDIGEVDLMIITQSARFKGYKDMDPAIIPQFEEFEREAIARRLLNEGVRFVVRLPNPIFDGRIRYIFRTLNLGQYLLETVP